MSDTETALDDDQLRAYLDTARDAGDERDRLVAVTLANTGMRHRELAHATADWLHLDRDHLRVPGAQQCDCNACQTRLDLVREAKLSHEPLVQRHLVLASELRDAKEQQASIVEQADVEVVATEVRVLRTRRAAVQALLDANWYRKLRTYAPGRADEILAQYDGVWWPREPDARRTIPLLDSTTRGCLADWFADHDAITMTPEEVRRRVVAVGEASPLDGEIEPLDLRWSYRRRLADLGFSAVEMQSVLGVSEFTTVGRFLTEQTSRVQEAFEERWEEV